MDRNRIDAILSGTPVAGLKTRSAVPIFRPGAEMEQCLTALNCLCAAPGTGQRRLELTSSQLPPIF
jgi:hypothetical protein